MTGLQKAGAIVGTLAFVGLIGYGIYRTVSKNNFPALVSRSGKKMVIKFKGKNIDVDVANLSKDGAALSLPGNKWSLKPSYGNQSDKTSLNGLLVTDINGVVHKSFYF